MRSDAKFYSEIFQLKFKHWVKNVISDSLQDDNNSEDYGDEDEN